MASEQQVANIKKWLGTGSINIFGWPFSGKDTQGRKLAQLFNAALVGGGEILRDAKDTPAHVRKIIDTGGLAPTDEYLEIITPYLSKQEYAGRPLILSSVGRWHGEEKSIVKAAGMANHPIKAVIYLSSNEDIARKRWELAQKSADRGKRADDAAEYLETRFAEFRNKTLPVINFYSKAGLLIEIDGTAEPNAVTSEIVTQLERLAQTS